MTEQPVEPEPTPVDDVLMMKLWRLEFLKGEMEHIHNEITVLNMDIERLVPDHAIFTDPDGIPYRAKVVRPKQRVAVDLHMLSRRRPEVYEAITKRVLDGKAVRRAFNAGLIDREIAQQAFTFTTVKPYVLLTDLTKDTEEIEESDDD